MCDNERRQLSWALGCLCPPAGLTGVFSLEFSVTRIEILCRERLHVPAAYHLPPCSPVQISGVN